MLQLFKLEIYLIKSSENTHIWLQFVANISVWNTRYTSCLKGIKITIETHKHTHTHTHTYINTHRQRGQKRLSAAAEESVKKKHL